MPCTKQNTKKYTQRNSPPYPANKRRIGQRKRGNDGQWYAVSKPNVNGVKRWNKASKSKNVKKTARTKIVVYTIEKCRPCKNAIEYLRGKDVSLTVRTVKSASAAGFLFKKTGQTTFPQIFVNSQFIGGFSELKKIRL